MAISDSSVLCMESPSLSDSVGSGGSKHILLAWMEHMEISMQSFGQGQLLSL